MIYLLNVYKIHISFFLSLSLYYTQIIYIYTYTTIQFDARLMLGAKTPKRLDDLTHEATGDTGILELVATGTDRHVETLG